MGGAAAAVVSVAIQSAGKRSVTTSAGAISRNSPGLTPQAASTPVMTMTPMTARPASTRLPAARRDPVPTATISFTPFTKALLLANGV